MESDLITFCLGMLVLIIGVFFLMPDAVEKLAFVGEKFYKGELWRIVTFNFVHLDLNHLIGNVIAFVITIFLTMEIGLKSEYFIMLFFVSSVTIALLEGIFIPSLIIAGTSLAIYSVLGGASYSGRRLIPLYIFLPLIILSIFLNIFFSDKSSLNNKILQSFFHFFGFLFGISLYYGVTKYLSRRKTLLEVA